MPDKRAARQQLKVQDVRVHAQGDELFAVVIDKLLSACANEAGIARCTLDGEQQGETSCDGFHCVTAARLARSACH